MCSLIVWFLCFFFLYIIFNYTYKILAQSLWWKHDHIAAIVIWLSLDENQLGMSLFTDIFHWFSADLSTWNLQNRQVVDVFVRKTWRFKLKPGDFKILKKKKEKKTYAISVILLSMKEHFFLPLNAGVFSIQCMLSYRNVGDYGDWCLVSTNIQTFTSINTRLSGKSWFWRKTEFILILRLILTHMSQITPKAIFRRCSWK